MLLRKDQGGATIAGYEWPTDGSVCEVPDALALELLDRPGFSEVVPDADPVDDDDPAKTPVDETATGGDGETPPVDPVVDPPADPPAAPPVDPPAKPAKKAAAKTA